MFPGRGYGNLSPKEKNDVRLSQRLQYLWRNENDLGKVFSTSCMKEVRTRTRDPVRPCSQCLSLLKNKNFKQALKKEQPNNKNMKFMPKAWRDEKAAAKWGHITGLKPIMEAHQKARLYLLDLLQSHCLSIGSQSALPPIRLWGYQW